MFRDVGYKPIIAVHQEGVKPFGTLQAHLQGLWPLRLEPPAEIDADLLLGPTLVGE